jgi:VanZ family protein
MLRHAWLILGAGFVLLVVWLSLTPDPLDAPRVAEVKSGHFLAYAWLMLWFAQLVRAPRARLALALGLVALGVGLEFAQALTPHRTFAYADMRDDAIGVIVGWLCALSPLGRILPAIDRTLART